MPKLKHAVLIFSLIITVFSSGILGQSEKAKKIDKFLSEFVNANQFGGQILVAENGKIIYEKAFGFANADFKIPNQLDTRIGIASITKAMTVTILYRLIDKKEISLDDKLSKFIPDFRSGDKITIDMLARHRSGIPHRVMKAEEESISYTSAEFIEKVKKANLDFEPGERNSYSSGGYSVLARALEIASGKSYAQLLDEYVFGPAGMKDSITFDGEMIMERRAQNYYPSPAGVINVPLKDYSFLVGAGSVFGTASDVYKFGDALAAGRYGQPAKAAFTGATAVTASGSTNGHRAYVEIDNGRKYGYAIVANMSGAFDMISQGIREILQDKDFTAKFKPTPKIIERTGKDLDEYSGIYKRTDSGSWNLVLRNGFLYASDIKLYPTRPDCFFEYRFFADVCFARDRAGKIADMSWKGAGFELKGIKQ